MSAFQCKLTQLLTRLQTFPDRRPTGQQMNAKQLRCKSLPAQRASNAKRTLGSNSWALKSLEMEKHKTTQTQLHHSHRESEAGVTWEHLSLRHYVPHSPQDMQSIPQCWYSCHHFPVVPTAAQIHFAFSVPSLVSQVKRRRFFFPPCTQTLFLISQRMKQQLVIQEKLLKKNSHFCPKMYSGSKKSERDRWCKAWEHDTKAGVLWTTYMEHAYQRSIEQNGDWEEIGSTSSSSLHPALPCRTVPGRLLAE